VCSCVLPKVALGRVWLTNWKGVHGGSEELHSTRIRLFHAIKFTPNERAQFVKTARLREVDESLGELGWVDRCWKDKSSIVELSEFVIPCTVGVRNEEENVIHQQHYAAELEHGHARSSENCPDG
jgi:hypothetical protein